MPPCHSPHTPAPSPQELLILAASKFDALPADANIRAAFDHIRTLLMRVVEGSQSPNTYLVAINTLNFGALDLDEFETTGDIRALERAKEKVQVMITLLP